MEIEGEISRCDCEICNGNEGQIKKDGVLVGRIWKDSAYHAVNSLTENPRDLCIKALKRHITALETNHFDMC